MRSPWAGNPWNACTLYNWCGPHDPAVASLPPLPLLRPWFTRLTRPACPTAAVLRQSHLPAVARALLQNHTGGASRRSVAAWARDAGRPASHVTPHLCPLEDPHGWLRTAMLQEIEPEEDCYLVCLPGLWVRLGPGVGSADCPPGRGGPPWTSPASGTSSCPVAGGRRPPSSHRTRFVVRARRARPAPRTDGTPCTTESWAPCGTR